MRTDFKHFFDFKFGHTHWLTKDIDFLRHMMAFLKRAISNGAHSEIFSSKLYRYEL